MGNAPWAPESGFVPALRNNMLEVAQVFERAAQTLQFRQHAFDLLGCVFRPARPATLLEQRRLRGRATAHKSARCALDTMRGLAQGTSVSPSSGNGQVAHVAVDTGNKQRGQLAQPPVV